MCMSHLHHHLQGNFIHKGVDMCNVLIPGWMLEDLLSSRCQVPLVATSSSPPLPSPDITVTVAFHRQAAEELLI